MALRLVEKVLGKRTVCSYYRTYSSSKLCLWMGREIYCTCWSLLLYY